LHRAAPAILASAATVVVGMLCLLFAELNWRRGLIGGIRRPQTPYAQLG